MKDGIREGVFDPRKISDSVKENILNRLSELEGIINYDEQEGVNYNE